VIGSQIEKRRGAENAEIIAKGFGGENPESRFGPSPFSAPLRLLLKVLGRSHGLVTRVAFSSGGTQGTRSDCPRLGSPRSTHFPLA
jgi:hypothetical protein